MATPLLPISEWGVEFPQIKIPSVVITVIRGKWVHFHNYYLVEGIKILFSWFLFFSFENINLNVTETMATVCGNRYLIFDTRVSSVLSDCIVFCLLKNDSLEVYLFCKFTLMKRFQVEDRLIFPFVFDCLTENRTPESAATWRFLFESERENEVMFTNWWKGACWLLIHFANVVGCRQYHTVDTWR